MVRLARFGILNEGNYRSLFLSTTMSHFGRHLALLAMPLVAISSLGADPVQVGLLSALEMAPLAVVGLLAGAWVDGLRRRSVLIVSDLGRAALIATVPLAWSAGALTMGHLYAVAFAVGVLTVFFDVAYQSYLPGLVGRGNLVEANARMESVRAVAQLTGPAIAGQIVRALTAPFALLVNAATFVSSAVFVYRIRKPEELPPRQAGRTPLVQQVGEGLRFVLGQRLLRRIAACTSTLRFFFAAYSTMKILFLERVIGLDAGTIGLVLMVVGAGGLLGAFVARRVVDWVGHGPAIWLSAGLGPPFALLVPLLAAPGPMLWVAAAGGAIFSASVIIYNVAQVSVRQSVTPDHLLGRMNATMRVLTWGPMPLGALLGGAVGGWLGIREAVLFGALGGCVAFLAVFFSPLRRMRELPAPAEPDPAHERA